MVFETRDSSDNQIGPDSDASVIAGLDWDRVYPLAGPVYVESAEPGDTLAIEIVHADQYVVSAVPESTFLSGF